MVRAQAVYNRLKDLANKDQKGFITPAVFDNFAALAQINIYNELFQELVKAKQIQRSNFDPGRDKSVRKQTLEDLSVFVVSEELVTSGSNANIFAKPSNLSKIISISASSTLRRGITWDNEDQRYNRREVELVYDVEKMDRILTSNLSTPTSQYPVALISQDIEVFPSSISSIRISYYRRPGSVNSLGEFTDSPPRYATVNMNNMEVFDPNNTFDFMLPPHYEGELVMEMAKLVGVRLRDPNLAGFASQEEASE